MYLLVKGWGNTSITACGTESAFSDHLKSRIWCHLTHCCFVLSVECILFWDCFFRKYLISLQHCSSPAYPRNLTSFVRSLQVSKKRKELSLWIQVLCLELFPEYRDLVAALFLVYERAELLWELTSVIFNQRWSNRIHKLWDH